MTTEQKFQKVRDELLDNCEITLVDNSKDGGQQVNIIRHTVSIKSKDLDIEILCSYHKSITSNKKTARLMMKRAIETIIE